MPLYSVLSTHYSVLLLLASLLLFGSDVMLWSHAGTRTPLDWLIALVGYVALAAVLLDFAARWRVRNIFGLLALAGLYGLSASLLIHPQTALADVPLTLITRVLGAHTLAGLLMLALFFTLLRGRVSVVLLVGSVLAGAMAGILGRWFPVALDENAAQTPLPVFLGAVVAGLIVLVVARLWVGRIGSALTAEAFMLSRRAWVVVGVVLVALLGVRLAQGVIDGVSLPVILTLLVFVGLLLWWQKRRRGVSLVEASLPPASFRVGFLLPAALFVVAAMAAYHIPRGTDDADPLNWLGTLFIAFGVVWLPTISLVLGGRAFLRMVRAGQL